MFVPKSLLAANVLLFAVALLAEKEPLDAAKVVGKWRSVKLEGKDIGTFIVSIDADFTDDGRMTWTAKVKEDGEVSSATTRGTYKVTKDAFEMTVDKETKRGKAWFEDGHLVIQDPELGSRVHFERVKPKK
jgi:uncharacterized protein (TIGR03066 family)